MKQVIQLSTEEVLNLEQLPNAREALLKLFQDQDLLAKFTERIRVIDSNYQIISGDLTFQESKNGISSFYLTLNTQRAEVLSYRVFIQNNQLKFVQLEEKNNGKNSN